MSFLDNFREELGKVAPRPIDVWVDNLSETDRVAFDDALLSDVSTSAIWRACRASGATFDRNALSILRQQVRDNNMKQDRVQV